LGVYQETPGALILAGGIAYSLFTISSNTSEVDRPGRAGGRKPKLLCRNPRDWLARHRSAGFQNNKSGQKSLLLRLRSTRYLVEMLNAWSISILRKAPTQLPGHPQRPFQIKMVWFRHSILLQAVGQEMVSFPGSEIQYLPGLKMLYGAPAVKSNISQVSANF